jgi:hypothetical protein
LLKHFLLACAAALVAPPQTASPVSCPETLKVVETAAPPAGWKAAGGQSEHPFQRVSIYNGIPGGQEYDLAPDAEKSVAGKTIQTWNLKDYRTMNLFLRCRYHDTSATLFMDVPASYTSCTFTFTLDKKGVFIGKSNLLCR